MYAAYKLVLQPKDDHFALIDVVMLWAQSLTDRPQRDAVRHRSIKLEYALDAGQQLIRMQSYIFAARVTQSCTLYKMLEVLRHVDIAILKYRQQLNDAIVH